MKQIYYIGSESWEPVQVRDDLKVEYLFTDKPIPKELQGKKINFDWHENNWIDLTDEANRNELKELKTKVTEQDQTIGSLTQQVTDLTTVTSGLSEVIVGGAE